MRNDDRRTRREQRGNTLRTMFSNTLLVPGILITLPLLVVLLGAGTSPRLNAQATPENVQTVSLGEIEANPEEFVGEQVAVAGDIAEVSTDTVFLLFDPELLDWDNMLVVHDGSMNLEENMQVQVVGTVMRGDATGLEEELGVEVTNAEAILQDRELVIAADRIINLTEDAQTVTLGDIEANPEEFVGEQVTVEGDIAEVSTDTVFLLFDPELLDWDNMLVVHDGNMNLEENMQVQVVGTVMRGDAVGLEEELGVEVPDAEAILQDRELVIAADRIINLAEAEGIQPGVQQEPTEDLQEPTEIGAAQEPTEDLQEPTETEAVQPTETEAMQQPTETEAVQQPTETAAAQQPTAQAPAAAPEPQPQPTPQPTSTAPGTLPQTGATALTTSAASLPIVLVAFGLIVSGFVLIRFMQRRQ